MEYRGHIIEGTYLSRTRNLNGTFDYDGCIYYDGDFEYIFYAENVGDHWSITGSISRTNRADNLFWTGNFEAIEVLGFELFDPCCHKPTRMNG